MPFGKFSGVLVEDIDDPDYLEWCLGNVRTIGPRLRRAIEKQIAALEGDGSTAVVAPNMIGQWYRRLATEFHPDKRGGSHIGMLAVNRAKELLVEMCEVAR